MEIINHYFLSFLIYVDRLLTYNIYVPNHEKTCFDDIKYDFLFLDTTYVSNCAEQMLKISCSYLV